MRTTFESMLHSIKNKNPYSYLLRRESSLMYQLSMLPLINPERMTNSSTRTFTAVKILFTIADSLTPNARIPREETHRKNKVKHDCEYNGTLLVMIICIAKHLAGRRRGLGDETCLPRALWGQLQRSLGRELIQVNPSQPVCPESWQWHSL